ncbi:MAG: hypothetical protein GC154_20590 [bacterium]|nr:hypothetical protein [bacterium]
MKPAITQPAILVLLLLVGGCAAHQRALREYENERATPFFQQTLGWIGSAAQSQSLEPSAAGPLPKIELEGAASPDEKFVSIASDFFQADPVALQQRIAALSESEGLKKVLQPRLTWNDLSLAVAIHNPAVRAARERWRATLNQYDQADFLDNLIGEYRSFTRYLNVTPGKPVNKQMLQSIYPFPGTMALKGEMVKEQVRLAELDWRRTLREKVVEAGQRFYDDQYVMRAQDTTRENIDLLQNLLSVVRELYQAGGASQAGIIKIQNELERQRNMLKDLDSRRIALHAQLTASLGLEPGFALGQPEKTNQPEVTLSAEDLFKLARDCRQEVLMQQSKINRTAIAIRMGEVMNRPSASQGYSQLERGMMPEASVDASKMPFGLEPKTRDRPAYAQAESYLAEMRQRLLGENAMMDDVLRETEAMARTMIETLDVDRREVHLIDNVILPQDQAAYEISLSDYQSGKATFLDLLDAERQLIKSRLESHASHRDLNQASVRLLTVSGAMLHEKK